MAMENIAFYFRELPEDCRSRKVHLHNQQEMCEKLQFCILLYLKMWRFVA